MSYQKVVKSFAVKVAPTKLVPILLRRYLLNGMFSLFILFMLAPQALAAPSYEITLIAFPGAQSTDAWGLNDLGQVVGDYSTDGSTETAFVWDADNGFTSLDPLDGYSKSSARAINNNGQITGDCDNDNDGAPLPQAFIYDVANGMQSIGNLGTDSSAWSINNNGMIGGESTNADGYSRAFIWTATEGMTDVVGNSFGTDQSCILGVNDTGQCALYRHTYDMETFTDQRIAYLWDNDEGLTPIGNLPTTDSEGTAYGWDVNNNSQMVGTAMEDSNSADHAFSWTSSDGVIQLDSGMTSAAANALNDKGQIVGIGDGENALLWDGGVQYNLIDLVQNSTGWSLTTAKDINTKGQIVGSGIYQGNPVSFLLTPVQSQSSAINLLLLL